MPVIRPGEARDLAAVAAMQAASPEAAQWNPAEYLDYDFRVLQVENSVAAFLVARRVAPDEAELLNLVVAPDFRRKGYARVLLQDLLIGPPGSLFLEVRESNQAARNLYKSMGFQEVNIRLKYYLLPPEAAIVMKFHSC
jgi:[ribosomal protein S18]-alanine N-acetyltransferase